MSQTLELAVLLLAAALEVGGDALVRTGLHASSITARLTLFAGGALLLFSYGYVVNKPAWDFGKLLGIYVVCVFVVAQLTSWMAFNQPPGRSTLIGGAFIVAGGVIMSIF